MSGFWSLLSLDQRIKVTGEGHNAPGEILGSTWQLLIMHNIMWPDRIVTIFLNFSVSKMS